MNVIKFEKVSQQHFGWISTMLQQIFVETKYKVLPTVPQFELTKTITCFWPFSL